MKNHYVVDYARQDQKRLYASKRLSKAVDRGIVATSEAEKAQAKKWVLAWNLVAKV